MLTHRLATHADIPALRALMALAIDRLQIGFLDERTIAASRAIMGLDTQLITDGTYFVIEADGALAGCGGWSRRATLFGGNHAAARDDTLLDPACEPARVRAMYTHPAFVRRGVGRLVLQLAEAAARSGGFGSAELAATLAGVPLYTACGWSVIEPLRSDPIDGQCVPLVRMGKLLVSSPA
ncbi:GNAT family N-acetyltransferase [Lichenicola cladoniae]|uniref:GNAT family N-acetyltransferase n=1 Tax=Lichenicola cladoniae TaxID=1484109 RepID=A0A6M8HM81_9PROT|nr:GNAT family N-acetyltransferase [Lichenicola cladoniae]NPD66935.1 GNAT family N-acetyltransferase [Acetobacteraceae bacterium]QKE89489.1 GNAT family N-acetyltransferase [Lichenicola cladoniae]